ncbi:MAG: hypothetical protein U1C53_02865 [Candidatus Veblenbacteria bacterium]|nr:hypothetical protein [Candidatus Veblenbacteria bacterium]
MLRGFGLVEAVVAVGVLITGIVAVVSLAQSNLSASKGVESRLVAVNLAREGVEAVRSLRDGNWLKGRTGASGSANAWDTGFNSSGDATGTAIAILDVNTLSWTIDFTPTGFSDSRTRMRRHPTRGLYRQSLDNPVGETTTQFSRLITVYAICWNNPGNQETNNAVTCPGGFVKAGVRVISEVQWQEGNRTAKMVLEEWLYNWRFSYTPYAP